MAPSQSARLTVSTSPTTSAARPSLVPSRLPLPHRPPCCFLDIPRGSHLRAFARVVPSDSHRASLLSVQVDAPSLEKPNTLMKLIFPISFFLLPLLFPRSAQHYQILQFTFHTCSMCVSCSSPASGLQEDESFHLFCTLIFSAPGAVSGAP